MNKPDDVPQGAWDLAARFMERAYPHGAKEFAARAIMAAKKEAFEEAAEMLDVFADTADFSAMNVVTEEEIIGFRRQEATLRGAAEAIRNMGADE